MYLNTKTHQQATNYDSNKKTNGTINILTTNIIRESSSKSSKDPSSHSVHRQLSSKTVNLKNNTNLAINNPFLSINNNWIPNTTAANIHFFNTISSSNKSNLNFSL